jgi:hypothetical protein
VRGGERRAIGRKVGDGAGAGVEERKKEESLVLQAVILFIEVLKQKVVSVNDFRSFSRYLKAYL